MFLLATIQTAGSGRGGPSVPYHSHTVVLLLQQCDHVADVQGELQGRIQVRCRDTVESSGAHTLLKEYNGLTQCSAVVHTHSTTHTEYTHTHRTAQHNTH